MQVLETLQILYAPDASGQRLGRGERKANLQHVEQCFNGAFSAPLLNTLLNTLLGQVLGNRRFADNIHETLL